MSKKNKMSVSERIVSDKGHTIGYVIGGEEYTRKQSVKLAKQGKVKDVRTISSVEYDSHLMGHGRRLYDLPTRMGTSNRFASLRSK